MSDVNEQFLKTFLEESEEGIDTMETGLLDLDLEAPDPEQINAIFRAAHSMKGGAGAFNFTEISDFTHVLETALDLLRERKIDLTQELLDVFLASVDALRALLEMARAREPLDSAVTEEPAEQLHAVLCLVESAEPKTPDIQLPNSGWRIRVVPHPNMMHTGNDPVRVFRELAELGELRVGVDQKALPPLDALDPEHLYLSWELVLNGEVSARKLDDVFDWLVGECEIERRELGVTTEFGEIAMELGFLSPSQRGEIEQQTQNDPLKRRFSIMAAVAGHMTMQQVERVLEEKKRRCEALEGLGGSPRVERVGARGTEPPSEGAPAPSPSGSVAPPTAPARPPAPASAQPPAPTPRAEGAGGARRAAAPAGKQAAVDSSIRVSTDRVDAIVNMVGELVITQSMLGSVGHDFDMSRIEALREGLSQLERNTREIQEAVMQIRMLPIGGVFQRFPRLVRDVSRSLDKKVRLVMQGEATELDKTVLEKIADPLVHCIRNSLDHGIESPDDRVDCGKPEVGTIRLSARHEGGSILIEVADDGRGIDPERVFAKAVEKGIVGPNDKLGDHEIVNLLFHAGFSTAEKVTDVSGRGVGLDVVKRNIKDLGGHTEIRTQKGQGSTFVIRLPLTVAILDGQLLRVGSEVYVLPLTSILETIQVVPDHVVVIAGEAETYSVRGEVIPVIRMHRALAVDGDREELEGRLLVIVEGDGRRAGLLVDELLAQQQVVIKSLEANFRKVQGISGATILGDGTVALILDVTGLLQMGPGGARAA